MPLPKRSIEPIHVSRSVYQQDELQSVELETVTNTTLTNIIRQLSSLSKHAEDVFGELARDVGSIGDRANSLQARIDRLSIKVTQLDSTVEEVPLTDITRKKAFKSAKIFDQQIFSRTTMSTPMLETYSQCDMPPPLDKLNIYRDDGKDGLKFYTDPNYFFELWRQEMIKDTERVMHDKGKKLHRPRTDGISGSGTGRGKKGVRTPHNTREKQRQIAIGHGETLMPNNVIYRTPNSVCTDDIRFYEERALRPNSIELNRNYQTEQIDGLYTHHNSSNTIGNISNNVQYVSAIYGTNGSGGFRCNQQTGNDYQQQMQIYDDSSYHQSQILYSHTGNIGSMSPETIYAPGTPSKSKQRPSQPPPAPPSNGSGGGTPIMSNANTPTRGRSMSATRETLPPPPPVPDAFLNSTSMGGGNNGATKLLSRTNSTSGTGSPQIQPGSVQDANAMLMIQLNNAINSFSNMNTHDLPPPLPVYDQQQPQTSSPNTAPPPPPPPPPIEEVGGLSPQSHQQFLGMSKTLINGDVNSSQHNTRILSKNQIQQVVEPKKLLPPFHDSRTDLMKAIRDGITLRKVEKSEQKEIERDKALHDVASILARRVAIELSESEESDSEEDSEGWVENNEISA